MDIATERDLALADMDMALRRELRPLRKYLDDPEVFEIRENKFGQVVCDTPKVLHADPRITYDYLWALNDHLLSLNGLGRTPISYVKLPDGSRGTFCWPPATVEGTMLMSIRKHLPVSKSLAQLAQEGRFAKVRHRKQSEQFSLEPFEEELLALLEKGDVEGFLTLAVKTKRNIAVAGPTGSGKTTLTPLADGGGATVERVLLMEDTHEIDDNRLDEVGYLMYGEGDGRMSARECLKLCMRLSPDRIFLTELRDDAAWDYLAGANTGHLGAFSRRTLTARPALLAYRHVGKGLRKSVGALDYDVIMKTINTTLDVVVYMEKREVLEILYDPMFKKQAMAAV
uniref:TraG homolog n=1 Tax=Pseudomonas putida TaxID=303 RepID=Q9WWU8_PSEPU|nr:TraG homolog [Pseudomonas putida]